MDIQQIAIEMLEILEKNDPRLFEHYCERAVLNSALGLVTINPIESMSYIGMDVLRFIAQQKPEHLMGVCDEIYAAMNKALWAANIPQRLFKLEPSFLEAVLARKAALARNLRRPTHTTTLT